MAAGDKRGASLVSVGRVLRRLFTVVCSGRMRDSRHILKQEMCRLGKRNFISMRPVKLQSRLPREIVQIEDLQIVFVCSLLKHTNCL